LRTPPIEEQLLADRVWGTETDQISNTGTFRWRLNDQT
jgi:hypothetical protein